MRASDAHADARADSLRFGQCNANPDAIPFVPGKPLAIGDGIADAFCSSNANALSACNADSLREAHADSHGFNGRDANAVG